MKCKAVRCIYYNAGNGYTVASYVTEETLPKGSKQPEKWQIWHVYGNWK